MMTNKEYDLALEQKRAILKALKKAVLLIDEETSVKEQFSSISLWEIKDFKNFRFRVFLYNNEYINLDVKI